MKKRNGFTLAELLLALATIIILASALMLLLQYSLTLSVETIFAQADDYNLRTATISISDNLRSGIKSYIIAADNASVKIQPYEGPSYDIVIVDDVLMVLGTTPVDFIPVNMKNMRVTVGDSGKTLKFVLETVNGATRTVENAITRVRT